jgi:hypothetical protein
MILEENTMVKCIDGHYRRAAQMIVEHGEGGRSVIIIGKDGTLVHSEALSTSAYPNQEQMVSTHLVGYLCKCGFYYERAGKPEQCPDCGGLNICYATDDDKIQHLLDKEETDRLYAKLKEFERYYADCRDENEPTDDERIVYDIGAVKEAFMLGRDSFKGYVHIAASKGNYHHAFLTDQNLEGYFTFNSEGEIVQIEDTTQFNLHTSTLKGTLDKCRRFLREQIEYACIH